MSKKESVALFFLVVFVGSGIYAKKSYDNMVFNEKIKLENIQLVHEVSKIEGERLNSISEVEKNEAYVLGETQVLMSYLAEYQPEKFIDTYLKLHPPRYSAEDSQSSTYSERESVRQENLTLLEERKEEAEIALENFSDFLSTEYFKQRVIISFRRSDTLQYTLLGVDEVTPLLGMNEDFPYEIKYFSRYNWIAESLDHCSGRRRYNLASCRYEVEYNLPRWEIPLNLGRKINPETFRLYADVYFSISDSRLGKSIISGGLVSSSRDSYFHAVCEQIDIYDSEEFNELVMESDCRSLNRYLARKIEL